jgi:predicted nucleic acid-binding protein
LNHLGLCVLWRAKMLLVISDACVLIDIECGNLTNAMFSLSYQFVVPDTLFSEELEERHAHLSQLGLICKTISGDLVAEAYSLHQKYVRPSVNDMLALILAKHEGCQLLTGDKALRDAAKDFNVEVHGTIWLVEQMLQEKKISVEVARIAFQSMNNFGSRLPWGEVEKLLIRHS